MTTIVVGVDGSEHSKRALRWALEEARLRAATLRVVHAWLQAAQPWPSYLIAPLPTERAELQRHAEAVTQELSKQLQKVVKAGRPPVVLCSPQIRAGLRQITHVALPKLAVLSLNEVTRDTAVEPHGTVPLNVLRAPAASRPVLQGAGV